MLPRILVFLPGPVPPPKAVTSDRFTFLSDYLEGDVLLPTWWVSRRVAVDECGEGNFPCFQRRGFVYHLATPLEWWRFARLPFKAFFFLTTAYRLTGKRRYDAIVTYGSNLTGLCGLILSKLRGIPLIVEVPGVPKKAFIYDSPCLGTFVRLKKWVADLLLNVVVGNASCVRLLYHEQLEGYPKLSQVKKSIFHEFTPISRISKTGVDGRYILFLGFPWYLKGVDILLKAFSQICEDFPTISLKLVGHFPDREHLLRLVEGISRVEVHSAVPHDVAIKLLEECSVLVLPSRTEAMGRVILEAMAAGKPIIASAIDGIPHYVSDEVDGLLFLNHDASDLADKLRRVLHNKELACRLGEAGSEKVRRLYGEHEYAESFAKMIKEVISDS